MIHKVTMTPEQCIFTDESRVLGSSREPEPVNVSISLRKY